MKYSRNKINKAGEKLLKSKKKEEVDEALSIINDWRSNHLQPLNELKQEIESVLSNNNITPVIISQRLKRLTSLQYKLDLNPDMRLGGMQDIGGLRIVLKDVQDLKKIDKILEQIKFNKFTLEKTNDYVQKPKSSGYRSIHLTYKYKSKIEDFDGLRIELQIRTKLQHNWATAVETAGLCTKTSLKSDQGSNEWLVFFKVISSLFAIKERLPVMEEHQKQSMVNLMAECSKLDKKNKFSSILRALKVTVQFIENNDIDNEYCILNIDLANRFVNINIYDKQDKEATDSYTEIEKGIDDNKNAVVLVAVSSIKELKAAYPSYFLDTTEFITALEKICENVKLYKL